MSEWSKEHAWKVCSQQWLESSNLSDSAILFPMNPTEADRERREAVVRRVLRYIEEGRRITLPPFDPLLARPSDRFALVNVGLEPNDFAGGFGRFRYQFEGEEDLLHLIVTAAEGGVTVAEGQRVASFVLAGVPTALIWLRPGELSQHFYVGHDDLVGSLSVGG